MAREANITVAARNAWRWWTGELRSLLPEEWREEKSRARILLSYNCVRIERVLDGFVEWHEDPRAIESLDEEAWEELLGLIDGLPTTILLSSPLSWTGKIHLPNAARSRLRSAVELQLPTAAPLPDDMLIWRPVIVSASETDMVVAVPMARRELVDWIDAQFTNLGRPTPPIQIETLDRAHMLRDGLRTYRRTGDWRRWLLPASAGAIAAIPVVTALVALLLTGIAAERIAVLEDRLSSKRAAESSWRKDEAIRQMLARSTAVPTVTSVVDALEARLPDNVAVLALGAGSNARLIATVRADSPQTIQQALHDDPIFSRWKVVAAEPQDADTQLITLDGALS